jgi:hypothetical protein
VNSVSAASDIGRALLLPRSSRELAYGGIV